MLTVLLVLQIIVTVSMVIIILIQRSSSDGMAGLAGGGNALMSGRASANLLTKITSILGAVFIINSLAMATIAARASNDASSLVDELSIEKNATTASDENAGSADATTPATTDEKAPDSKPSVPIAE